MMGVDGCLQGNVDDFFDACYASPTAVNIFCMQIVNFLLILSICIL